MTADWPDAPVLVTSRLELVPLRADDAAELAPLLDDPRLHEFIGGSPSTVDQLRATFTRQAVGHSTDGSERWFNWVVRDRASGVALGTVQATVTSRDSIAGADVAWVIASAHQSRGYAREAAAAMVAWLRSRGAETITAHIHPDHNASQAVARALGLSPTEVVVDGENRWVG